MQPGINIFYPSLSDGVSSASPGFTPTGIERRFCRFSIRFFIAQLLLCILPAAGLLAVGRTALAGYYFFGMLGLVLLRLSVAGRRDEILCLILAVGPFLNLLRQFAFYNVIIAIFAMGLFYYFAVSSGILRDRLKKFPLFWALGLFVAVFYLISFINTRQYSVNIRMFELVFAVLYVLVIGRNENLLGATLLGLILSACAVGASMLPHIASGARLGMIETGGQMIGNPTQLGIPLAFGFLAISVDRGRWLNLQTRPLWRALLIIPILTLLALTTSRAAWLVAAGGIFIAILLGNRQRIKMWLLIVFSIVACFLILKSPFGESLERGLRRTFDDQRSMRQRTSGRSDQWKVSWYAFNKSIDSKLVGYGPGMGPEIYAKYSGLVSGVKYGVGQKASLHSLFMQIGVEAGLAGLGLVALWLMICFFKILGRTFQSHLVFPTICFAGYVFIVVTVSGGDINSGLFLGTALLGTLAAAGVRRRNSPDIPGSEIKFGR